MTPLPTFVSPTDLLRHLQSLRRLTRRTIEAFPEDKLFTFSIGGMRPFGEMVKELLAIAAPMVRGVATREWGEYTPAEGASKADLLATWDADTEEINARFGQIPVERFQETMTAFGQYTAPVFGHFFYVMDNENHHRGQGYVYLRALGIEPPAFWDMS